jgi:hypothetical protein
MAVEAVFIGASNELGAFESGLVAQAVGTPATVIGGGVATLVVVGTWWFAFPSLRVIDRFEDVEHRPMLMLPPDLHSPVVPEVSPGSSP